MAVKECCCVKLSLNKKSIFGLGMWSQILYLLLASCILAVSSAADAEETCANVKSVFEKKGMLSAVDIQTQPNSDANELCLNRGCCGPASRARLTAHARTQLEGALRSELGKLADMLAHRATKFDEFFRTLLRLSREEFHSMFKRTYGMIYEQHSYVFEQLFEELERYYTRGDTNFDNMMDRFFGILYQKMFTVLNSQYYFDEQYLKCVNEHMRDIQPFEDVPSKLSVQLRRAVVATRIFHKALRVGADVVRNMIRVAVTNECVTSWARLRFCGACGGVHQPACSRYCHNVVRGCLPAHADIGEMWDAYVDAVDKVAERLLGPFNIAMVVEPIDIKISEAIMSFQEHNHEISQKIFTGCGKPVLGGGGGAGHFFAPEKTRRSVRSIPDFDWYQKTNDVDDFEIEASFESLMNEDPSLAMLRTPRGVREATEKMAEEAKSRDRFLQYMKGKIGLDEYEEHERKKRDADPEPLPANDDINFKPLEFEGKKGPKRKKPFKGADDSHGSEWGGPALEKLVKETRVRMRNSRQYWHHLPALLCSATSIPNAPCFNGTAYASYTLNAAGEGSAGLASNPEVRGAAAADGAEAAGAQADVLRAITGRLKDAFNGQEVHWAETERELEAAGAGLPQYVDGEGSGSGDYNSGDDGPPDDDEDRDNDYGMGSGSRPTEDGPTNQPAPPEEPPVVPSVVDPPSTNNVNFGVTLTKSAPMPDDDEDDDDEITADIVPDVVVPRVESPPVDVDEPASVDTVQASAADRPSLQKAVFAYALPVVCAWFGRIVTDLF